MPLNDEYSAQPQNNREAVRKCFAKIKKGEDLRDKYCDKYRWKEFLEEFKGHFNISEGSYDIQINPLNFVFAYVKTEIPALYFRDPNIKLNPKKGTSIQAAKISEIALNQIWRTKLIKRQNKKNVADGKLIGHSWFKTGYTGRMGTVEDGNGNVIETIESEDFFGYRVPWDCIVFDPDSVDPPYDCKWIAHMVWAPLDDVKKNPRYKNAAQVRPMMRKSKDSKDTTANELEGEYDEPMACLHEVWDIKKREVFTVSEGMDDYLEPPKQWPYKMKGYPFSYLNFNPINDEPYGLPDVYMFEPQVLELMKLRAMMLDHIKRFNRQLVTTPNNLTQEMKDNLMLGVTANVIEASEPEKIFPIPYAQLQTDIYALEERLKEDMINISGQSPQERGATQKTTTRTFRELAQIQRGAENRRSEQIDVVEDFVEDIAGNLLALLQQFADVPYYVKLTGKQPEEIMEAIQARPSASSPDAITSPDGFTFTREDIQGEFDIEVVAGSTAPLDKDNTMQTLLSLIEMFPAFGVQPGGPLAAAVGRMIVEMLQMPELERAIEEEAQYQAKLQEQQQQALEATTQMQVAEKAAKTQIEAEKVATKQSDLLLKSIEAFKPKPVSEVGPRG